MSATNKRITELTSASAIASDDYMAIDSVARGTKKYKVSEILDKIDDDFDTVVSEMQFSNPPDVYPYNKGDIVWRDDNGTKKIYVAKDDYPSGVTEYDSDEWDEYDTLAEVIKADVPVASEISYDNTTSGLTATDVQNAIDEVSGDIPTTLAELSDDDTHRTVTDTEKTTWSGKQDALTFDNVPTEDSNNPVKSGGIFDEFADKQAQIDINTMIGTVPNLPASIATFSDGAPLPMPKLEIAVEPQQDLHGYDAPWGGGSGKNKFQTTATTQTVDGVTYTVNTDGTISLSGTASGSYSQLKIGTISLPAGTYKISDGLVLNQNYELYIADIQNATTKYNKDQSFTIENDVTNKVIYFYIKAGQNVNGLTLKPMIRLASVTDSTFAPYSNICQISGWSAVDVNVSGVNVWDEEWELGYLDGGNGQPTTENTSIRSKNFNGCVPNTNYYGSTPTTSAGTAYYIYWYDADKNFISRNNIGNATVMSPSNAMYFKLACYHYGSTYNNDISINYPSTDTEYHAYNGSTITIPFLDSQGNPIEVYGGSVDVVNGGEQLNTKGKDDLGNLNWGMLSANIFYTGDIPTKKYGGTLMCSQYPVVTNVTADSEVRYKPDKSICGNTTNTLIYIKDSSYSDTTTFKNAMRGVELVYELVTPTTFYTHPTAITPLEGTNNLSANTGDVLEASYVRDATLTINDILARIEALENA